MRAERSLNAWINEVSLWELPLVLVTAAEEIPNDVLCQQLSTLFVVFSISPFANVHGICLFHKQLCHLYCLLYDEPLPRQRCLWQRARWRLHVCKKKSDG